MSVVKVLIDRAMESRNYANVIATACDKIIDVSSNLSKFKVQPKSHSI